MALPLMRKATAVWLVENTSLTFKQISQFCGLHELEVSGIADGEVASGIRGMDPVSSNQLTAEEIEKCEKDPNSILKLSVNPATVGEKKRRGPRYTPLSKRQDKPAAIAWLVKYYSELTDAQIVKLVGTTKPTIQAVRSRTHWNITNIVPTDPVILGLCKQVELDLVLEKSNKTTRKESIDDTSEGKNKLSPIRKSSEQQPAIMELESPVLEDKKLELSKENKEDKQSTLLEAEKFFTKDTDVV